MKFIIEHLSKRFEQKEVLKDIDFTFEEGRIYGLLGRNGAGKTTLFNCLNRDIKADSGSFIGWYNFYLKDGYTLLYGLRTKRTANDPLNSAISLSTPLDDSGEVTLGDAVADPNSAECFERVEDALYRHELHNALCEALKTIPAEYRSVIERRYFNGQTIKSIAADLLTTVNEVKRCESGGLWAIRRSPAINTLRSFSDFDFYRGAGLRTFRHTGESIQESYLIYEENAKMCSQKKEMIFSEKIA